MSTVKISELPLIPRLNQDTTQTLFTGVDLVTNITGKLTASILAQSLYSHNQLNVGNNAILFSNTIAQFSGSDPLFLQVNQQNFNSTGSGDYIITGDSGTNSNNYIDFGLNGSQWNNEDYTSMYANDGYLYVQGTGTNAQGNLVIGTASPNTQINFIVGGTNAGDINASLTQNSFVLLNGTNLTFTDGSSQNTSAAPFAISNIGFSLANSSYGKANAVGVFANAAFAEANSVGVFANGAFSLANSVQSTVSTQGLTLLNTQNFANGAFTTANSASSNTVTLFGIETTQNTNIQSAWNKANNALANATGTFAGDLTFTGNVIASGIQSTTGAITTGNLIVNGITTSNGTANIIGTLNVSGIVAMNAQVVLTNTSFTSSQAALTISASPSVATPSQDGYMIHISGKQNVSSRIVTDSYGANTYVVYAGRSARGNVTNPTAVQSGDILARFSGNGYGTTGYAPLGVGRIDFVATENYTDSARGSQIQFFNMIQGTNTLNQIATFNAFDVTFTGEVNPQKGFVLTPNVISGITTSLTIDIANTSLFRFTTNATTSISLTGFKAGKIVEVWITNTDSGGPPANHTITHGCLANNSTVGAASFTLSSLHSAYIKYFSIDGDQANVFCQVSYS